MKIKEKDKKFLSALKDVYTAVTSASAEADPSEVRKICTQLTREAFALTNVQIKGSEYLPYQKNAIFIYNHLSNHPYYTEDEGFQITLDSHFISSIILDKYYGDSGMRVVRHSLPEENNHMNYYDRLKFIRVYSQKFLPEGLDVEEVKTANKEFYPQAMTHLSEGSGLVFSPEGNSYPTGDSPGIFRHGIFKLACMIDPQPLIVPLVMANFDQLASETTFKCEIKPSFRMQDLGVTSKDIDTLPDAVQALNKKYKKWIGTLQSEENGFELEISNLKKRIKNQQEKEDLVVFYGSSTIRLWKSLQEDFPNANTLNLGFGGAYIDSLSEKFEELFCFKAPKAIVLYLGGNDLSLGWSADRIVHKITALISKIHQKFPTTNLINISIKPSLERSKQLNKIVKINDWMENHAKKTPFLNQIDLYQPLMLGNEVDQSFLLQDGLHLNERGYKTLKNQLVNHV